MEFNQVENNQADHSAVLNQVRSYALEATPWLKFIGVMMIIYGVIIAITIVGIIIAWLPIWMGILLFQAGNAAKDSQMLDNPTLLVDMMRKLKTFFIINGVLLIIGLIGLLFSFMFTGAALFSMFGNNGY